MALHQAGPAPPVQLAPQAERRQDPASENRDGADVAGQELAGHRQASAQQGAPGGQVQDLLIPNTNGVAGTSLLVTSPLSEKICFSTGSSICGAPLLKSSLLMSTHTTFGA